MKPINRIFLFLLFISVSYAISYAQENQSYFLHTIEKGQSLYSISKMYNVTTSDIIRLNPGCDEKIYAGQTIKIPTGKESQKGETFHTIQAGETLYKLTTMYNVSAKDICEANPGLSAENFRIGQVILIPVFTIMKQMNLLNTYPALFLVILDAFGVFLMRQFMEGIPDELIESAKIDGCGELRIFLQIIVPLSKPVIVSLVVFTFITSWNDFIWPLVMVTKDEMKTLTLGLSMLQNNYVSNYGLVMAGATVAFIFPFILYCILQRKFVEGIALSGIKG